TSTSISPPSTSHQPHPTTLNDPPWVGWIETTGDALPILEAARCGLIPRVTRCLLDSERKMITSGSVFIFDEDEFGIKRRTLEPEPDFRQFLAVSRDQ
ncbi:Gti1/Pac2 family-domain-containing protein, partial [Lentinula raphanica]